MKKTFEFRAYTYRDANTLFYGDVVKVGSDKYFLLVQCGPSELVLIPLTSSFKEWNRSYEPKRVTWGQLTIQRFKKLFEFEEDVVLVTSETKLSFEEKTVTAENE